MRISERFTKAAVLFAAIFLMFFTAACSTAAVEAPAAGEDEIITDGSGEEAAEDMEDADEGDEGTGSDAGSDDMAAGGLGRPIVVGSKGFTEAFILGHMYALMLEGAGFDVEREIGIGATPIAHAAMVAGEIDLYPEYTSTALLTVLQADPISDRDEVYAAVSAAYLEEFDQIWLDPSPFNNPQALATRQDVSEEYGVTTYTELAAVADQLSIGAPPEFFEREDGLPGVQGAYGGFEFAEKRQLDPGLRYEALVNGDVDVVLAFGTDGQISGFDLVLLEDDQNFFTPYPVAPIVRGDVLAADPGIATLLNSLAPVLTNDVMQALNWSVDGPEKREPEDVARDFLLAENLIE